MGKLSEGRLADGFRREINRLLDSGYTQARLAKELGLKGEGGLQKWIREDNPSTPSLAVLELLQKVRRDKSITHTIAWLVGETIANPKGESLAGYGEKLTDEEFLRLHDNAPLETIMRRARLLTQMCEEILMEQQAKAED